jgi:hypothetical protein
MDNRFDELAKAVAEGMTRREVLSRLRGVLAGGALAFLGMRAASADQPDWPTCGPGEHRSICDVFRGEVISVKCCPDGQHCTRFLVFDFCVHGHG